MATIPGLHRGDETEDAIDQRAGAKECHQNYQRQYRGQQRHNLQEDGHAIANDLYRPVAYDKPPICESSLARSTPPLPRCRAGYVADYHERNRCTQTLYLPTVMSSVMSRTYSGKAVLYTGYPPTGA